jgi:hypothetical protein
MGMPIATTPCIVLAVVELVVVELLGELLDGAVVSVPPPPQAASARASALSVKVLRTTIAYLPCCKFFDAACSEPSSSSEQVSVTPAMPSGIDQPHGEG